MKSDRCRAAYIVLGLALSASFLLAQVKKSPEQTSQPASAYRSSVGWAEFSGEQLLQKIDADHDGVITREEWESFFRDHDENKDGRLVPEELQFAAIKEESKEELNPNYGREKAFKKLDVNGDGVIERSEWPGNDRSFKRMDANRDGVVNREEFMSRNGRFWNELFEDLDFNGDGLISHDEWLDSEIAFQRLDHDKNGVIDRYEFYTPK